MSQTFMRRLVAFAFAACAMLGLAATAPLPVFAISDVPGSNVFTLPVPAGAKNYGASFGDTVVWDQDTGIGGYVLSQKKYFELPNPVGCRLHIPVVSDRWIVCVITYDKSVEYRPGSFRTDQMNCVYAYDRATEATEQVTTGGAERNCALSGDTLVWVETANPNDFNIYGKNLATGATFTVSAAPGSQFGPDIAGDWVVYSEHLRSHPAVIKAYNIVTGATKTLCSGPGDQYYPRIGESGFVAWQRQMKATDAAETTDIYGCYVTDGVIRRVAGGPHLQASPSIGANLVVYMDAAKPKGYGVVGYDLLSGTHFGVSKTDPYSFSILGIKGGTIVRLFTPDVWPLKTTVQLVWPTQLDIISDDAPVDESVQTGDDNVILDPSEMLPLRAGSLAMLSGAAAESRVSTVVMSAAGDWANSALAAGLAGRYSPLLLTSGTSVSAKVLAKLAALAPRHVVIVGGRTSTSDSAAAHIAAVVGVGAVTRVAAADRTSGSLEVAAALASRPGWDGTVFVTGSITSSLLTVPVSVWKNLPLAITGSKGLSTAQVAKLMSMGAKRFVVVGGGVPPRTIARLKSAVGGAAVKSLNGRTIASTSEKFASWAAPAYGLTWDGVGIASASDWSRTVMAALSRGRVRSVLLLSDPKKLSSEVKGALVTHHRAIKHASFVGPMAIMSINVRSQVRLTIK